MKSVTPSARRLQCANVGVGVLIFLALCLCGLVVFQWVVQSRLRDLVETERTGRNKLLGERQELENKAKRYSDEITRVQELRTKLEEEKKTNLIELRKTTGDLSRLRNDFIYATNALVAYSNFLAKANTNLLLQNAQIEQLGEATKKAMQDRNEIVTKYNDITKKYSDLVTNYNGVVAQFEDYQKQVKEMLAKEQEPKK